MTNRVILAQTDTTVGFLSRDAARLAALKSRRPDKPFLKVYADLKLCTAHAPRIPARYRNLVRRARATTFVVNQQAFRVVKDPAHLALLRKLGWCYSTSANRSTETFDETFCRQNSDIIAEDSRGLHEAPASAIYRLGRTQRRKLR